MMTKRRPINILLTIVFIVLTLEGCKAFPTAPIPTPGPDQMDRSPFTGIPCAAPCWRGLLVGGSNEKDALSVLSTLTFIKQPPDEVERGTLFPSLDLQHSVPGVIINASCVSSKKQCLSLNIAADILTEIDDYLNYSITLDEAIGYLGDPDYTGYENLGGEEIICEIDLVWKTRQIVLASEKYTGYTAAKNCGVVRDTGKTNSSLLISEVRYESVDGLQFTLSGGANGFYKYSGTLPGK